MGAKKRAYPRRKSPRRDRGPAAPAPQTNVAANERTIKVTECDSVQATFAFVDLSGFSVLTEMCGGDEQAASLAGRLLAVARESLGPSVTIVKTMGDAVMLRASETEPMVATILRLADRAAEEDGFLALRAGIHHGSAVQRDMDYFGHGVNVAARLTALAGAGQAVVTEKSSPGLRAARPLAGAIRSQATSQHCDTDRGLRGGPGGGPLSHRPGVPGARRPCHGGQLSASRRS